MTLSESSDAPIRYYEFPSPSETEALQRLGRFCGLHLLCPPSTQALTFGLLQKSGDAVGVLLGLPELHQRQEEGLQGGVEGLEQGETQAEAFQGDACDRAQGSGVADKQGGGGTGGEGRVLHVLKRQETWGSAVSAESKYTSWGCSRAGVMARWRQTRLM